MQDVQIFCVQGVAVSKTIVQRRDGPFFRKVFIFRAVKPDAKVIVLSPRPKTGCSMISSEPWYIVIRFSMIFPFFFDYITTVIVK